MKFLSSLLLILFTSFAFAGPGDGPIVPWPTNVVHDSVAIADLEGDWVAYGHNSVWYIQIHSQNPATGIATISIKSTALFTHQAKGWIYSGPKVLWGKIVMNESHAAPFIVFRDEEGPKIRLVLSGPRHYLDLKIYRTK